MRGCPYSSRIWNSRKIFFETILQLFIDPSGSSNSIYLFYVKITCLYFSDFYLPSSNSFAVSTVFELCYVSKWKCGLSKYQSPFFDVRCLLLPSCRIFPSSTIYRIVNDIVDTLCFPCFLARFYYFLHSSLSGNLSHGLSSGIMLLSR